MTSVPLVRADDKAKPILVKAMTALKDSFEGNDRLDFDLEMLEHHPDLKKKLEDEVAETGSVDIKLTEDVYNLYFLALLKKQKDGTHIHVCSFVKFLFKDRFGGWPAWTFLLQVLSCILATSQVLDDSTSFPKLDKSDWVMLLVCLNLCKYAASQQILELTVLQSELYELRKEPWLTAGRLQALTFIIGAKTTITIMIYVCTVVEVISNDTAMTFLKTIAAMAFVSGQAKIAYQILDLNNTRRKLGLTGMLHTGLADFNLKIKVQNKLDEEQPKWLWWCMRIVFYLSYVAGILRMPWLHDATFGKFESFRCDGILVKVFGACKT